MRQLLVDALVDCSVYTLRERGWESDFVGGRRDVDVAALDMDSLSQMELCLVIERETGVSLEPEQLVELGTLGRIAELMERRDPS